MGQTKTYHSKKHKMGSVKEVHNYRELLLSHVSKGGRFSGLGIARELLDEMGVSLDWGQRICSKFLKDEFWQFKSKNGQYYDIPPQEERIISEVGGIDNPIRQAVIGYNKVAYEDRKVPEFKWKEVVGVIKGFKNVYDKAKEGQDKATCRIDTDSSHIAIIQFGDSHFGSWSTDYDYLQRITEYVKRTPNVYIGLLGDMLQMSIVLRSVAEVGDNMLPIPLQFAFLKSWLEELGDKVLFSTWDNHSQMREEKLAGYSNYARIMSEHTVHFNGIGDLTISVNGIDYKWVVSHFYRGRAQNNPLHAHYRFIREQCPWADVIAAGDSHQSGILMKEEGGTTKLAINSGSLQGGNYARRFFALERQPYFPVVVLSGTNKMFNAFYSIEHYQSLLI